MVIAIIYNTDLILPQKINVMWIMHNVCGGTEHMEKMTTIIDRACDVTT